MSNIPDPQCKGTGILWATALNHTSMPCWRCAGTGVIPELIAPKEPGRMPFRERPDIDGPAVWGSEDESTQDA